MKRVLLRNQECGILEAVPVLISQFLWQRGLRRRPAVARTLGLWVRIPAGVGCMFLVNVVCFTCRVCAEGADPPSRGILALVCVCVCVCVCVIEYDQAQQKCSDYKNQF
jgi:hypothetical protein